MTAPAAPVLVDVDPMALAELAVSGSALERVLRRLGDEECQHPEAVAAQFNSAF